jgi:hypothetical protein
MIITLAKWTIILFGVCLICAGFLMLFAPEKARAALRKAGSTNLINYGEITLRLIPGIAFILYSDYSRYPDVFNIFGWFMVGTCIILYLIPRTWHHAYSVKSAELLKPLYFQVLSPLAWLFGATLLYWVS